MQLEILNEVSEKLKSGQNSLTLEEMSSVVQMIEAFSLNKQRPQVPEVEEAEEDAVEEAEESEEAEEEVEEEPEVKHSVNDRYVIKNGKIQPNKKAWKTPSWIKWTLTALAALALVAVFFFPGAIGLTMMPWYHEPKIITPNAYQCIQEINLRCGSDGPNYFGIVYDNCCETIVSDNAKLCASLPNTTCATSLKGATFPQPNVLSAAP